MVSPVPQPPLRVSHLLIDRLHHALDYVIELRNLVAEVLGAVREVLRLIVLLRVQDAHSVRLLVGGGDGEGKKKNGKASYESVGCAREMHTVRRAGDGALSSARASLVAPRARKATRRGCLTSSKVTARSSAIFALRGLTVCRSAPSKPLN